MWHVVWQVKEEGLIFVVLDEPDRFLCVSIGNGILVNPESFHFVASQIYHRTHVVGIRDAEIFIEPVLKR